MNDLEKKVRAEAEKYAMHKDGEKMNPNEYRAYMFAALPREKRISELESDREVWKSEAGRLFEERDKLKEKVADLEAEATIARERLGPAGYQILEEVRQLRAACKVMREALEKIRGFHNDQNHYTSSMQRSLNALAEADAILGEGK